jgi:hypothetical protein
LTGVLLPCIPAPSLKNAYLNLTDEDKKTILKVYQEYNENLKLMINRGFSQGTYERHVTSRKHLEKFINETFHLNDYYLKDIDHSFIVKYDLYLRIKRNCANNTTTKYIGNFGKIIKIGINNDWIRKKPTAGTS